MFRTGVRRAVFADSADGKVGTLYAGKKFIIRAVVTIEFRVIGRHDIPDNLRFLIDSIGDVPLYVGIVAVPWQIASPVGIGMAEYLIDGIYLRFRKSRVREHLCLVKCRL